MSELGFGIIGCGGAAWDVVEALAAVPGTRVAAAFDRNPEAASKLAAASGAPPGAATWASS